MPRFDWPEMASLIDASKCLANGFVTVVAVNFINHFYNLSSLLINPHIIFFL